LRWFRSGRHQIRIGAAHPAIAHITLSFGELEEVKECVWEADVIHFVIKRRGIGRRSSVP
jgi:hypothetical protein